MVDIIQVMAGVTDLPLIAKPNAGRPRLEAGRTIHDGQLRPGRLGCALYRARVRMIGGCCGTNPEFIRAAAEVLAR